MTWAGARGNTEKQMAKVLHIDLPQEKLHPGVPGTPGHRQRPRCRQAAVPTRRGQPAVGRQSLHRPGPSFSNHHRQLRRRDADCGFPEGGGGGAAGHQPLGGRPDAGQDQGPAQPGRCGRPDAAGAGQRHLLQGKWLVPFEKTATKTEPFNLRGGKTVAVPMMKQTDHLGYFKGKDFQAVAHRVRRARNSQ